MKGRGGGGEPLSGIGRGCVAGRYSNNELISLTAVFLYTPWFGMAGVAHAWQNVRNPETAN